MKRENNKAVIKLFCHLGRLLSGVSRFYFHQARKQAETIKGRCRIKTLRHDNLCLMGFTLIELLVVVLIIGILASTALPQYQKAVEKSKSAQAFTLLKSISQTAEEYYLANGTEITSFNDLSIELPSFTGNVKAIPEFNSIDSKSNKDWSLQLTDQGDGFIILWMHRISGKYKGGGIALSLTSGPEHLNKKFTCSEIINGSYALSPEGAYCHKIMKANYVPDGNPFRRLYTW